MDAPRRGPRRIRNVLGLMSGTSVDGLDLVLVEFRGESPRLIGQRSVVYPAALRDRILRCAAGTATAWELAQLHHDLGRWYARQAVRCARLRRWDVDLVGLHGQTVFHRPAARSSATLQLGEPAPLAAALGVPVVTNFRAMDLAVGGQGAPLATLFHVRVFARRGEHVCVQNLGGIGNVTSIDGRRSGGPEVKSFDTGPGNMLLDAAMSAWSGGRETMDRGGRCAAAGRPHLALVERWLNADAFVCARPPKSTGRERYGKATFEVFQAEIARAGLDQADALATLTVFTAATVASNYRRHLPGRPDRVVLCGGGARNPSLRGALQAALEARFGLVPLSTSDDLGWPTQAVEGAAFALLARERWLERAGNLASTTGARRPVLCGQVTIPWPRVPPRQGS